MQVMRLSHDSCDSIALAVGPGIEHDRWCVPFHTPVSGDLKIRVCADIGIGGRPAAIASCERCGKREAINWTRAMRQIRQTTMFDPLRLTMATASDTLFGSPLRNLTFGVVYMLVVMALGVVSYMLAGWTFGDAVYMVVITVYTVGYGETMPVDTALLRTITICIIVLGCTGMIFLTGALVQFITLSQINRIFGIKRMSTQIDRLRDHVIICGYGRIGAMLARELRGARTRFVIVEQSDVVAAEARELGYLCLHADATNEAALVAAGIRHARTLATVLSSDAANVFITLSARSLNPKLDIIARGELPSTENKLILAGANKVVLPAHIGAERIAEMILYQETAKFIHGSDRMKDFEKVLLGLGLDMDVVVAEPHSSVIGKTIEAIEQEGGGAFFIVQINRRDGEAVTGPEPSTVIRNGDGVVLVGRGPRERGLSGLFEATGHAGTSAPAP
jgi:voltage-gated potassium channel